MKVFNIHGKEFKVLEYEDDHKYHVIFTEYFQDIQKIIRKSNENRRKRIVFDEDGHEIGKYGYLFSK